MATQTGSIDLEATNAAKLYAEAGFTNAAQTYATKSELTVSANQIRGEVAETYATKDEAALELSGSGTVVVLDEAADARLKALTIHGLSVQDGTPTPSAPVAIQSVQSRNLLNPTFHGTSVYNGAAGTAIPAASIPSTLTYSFDENGVEMKSTAGWGGAVIISEPLTTGSTYILSVSVAATTSSSVRVTTYTLDSDYVIVRRLGNYANNNDAACIRPSITIADGERYVAVSASSATANETVTIYQPQLDLGDSLGVYIPYGSIQLRTVGTNIATLEAGYGITESDGVFTGTSTRLNTKYSDKPALVQADGAFPKTVTVSFEAYTDGNATTSGNGIMVIGKNAGGTIVQYFASVPNSTTSWTRFEGTTGRSDIAIIGISYSSGGANIWHIRNLCIRLDGSTEYVPYIGTTTPIDLQGHALRSLPDGTHDEWISGESADTLVQRVKRNVYDGSGTITKSSSSSTLDNWKIGNSNAEDWKYSGASHNLGLTATMTNSYPVATGSFSIATGPGISIWADGTYLRTTKDLFADSTAVAAWLNANPVEVLYPLATPVTTTLPHVNLPYVHDGDSVWVDAQVTPNIDVTYWSKNGETVSALSSTLTQTAAGLELELQGKIDSDEEWVSWMHAGTDATTHEPYLAMGQDSDYPSVVYGSDAARFYDGEGDADSNVVASFGADGAVVGKTGAAHFEQTSSASKWYGSDGTTQLAEIGVSSSTPYLWLGDSYREIVSFTDVTPGLAYRDNLKLLSNGATSSHEGAIIMTASGTSGTAGMRICDNPSSTGNEDATLSPGKLFVDGTVETHGFLQMAGTGTASVSLDNDSKAAWLAALGLDVQSSNMTYASGLNSSYGSAPVRKYGAMGILKLNSVRLASQLASGGSVVIGTLPTGYVPVGSVDMHINIESNSSNYRNNYIIIEYSGSTNPGRVTLYNRSGYAIPNTVTFSCTCPFFI